MKSNLLQFGEPYGAPELLTGCIHRQYMHAVCKFNDNMAIARIYKKVIMLLWCYMYNNSYRILVKDLLGNQNDPKSTSANNVASTCLINLYPAVMRVCNVRHVAGGITVYVVACQTWTNLVALINVCMHIIKCLSMDVFIIYH